MTKFSWRRESSLTTSGSLKMDSCLVLTECWSRQILRFRTSEIDLIQSERVPTSTSSVFAHRLTYSSHVSMIMQNVLVPLILDMFPVTILRSPVTTWPHGLWNCESEQLQGKDLGRRVAANLLCNWGFWSNRTGIDIRKAWRLLVLKVCRDCILDGLLIFKTCCLHSKHQCL